MYSAVCLSDAGFLHFYHQLAAVVTIGFVKDAKHHVDVQGFNVYHKNRLIKVCFLFALNTVPLMLIQLYSFFINVLISNLHHVFFLALIII